MSQLISEEKNSLSGIPLPSLTVHDIYELIYRLTGGALLYIVIFHKDLNFSQESILSLFPGDDFSIFSFIIFLFLLLVLSTIASYFFSFIDLIAYLLFHLKNQFKVGSFLFKKMLFLINCFFPKIIKDDFPDENFYKTIRYFYNMNISSDVDKRQLSTISRDIFFKIVKDYTENVIGLPGNNKYIALIDLQKNVFIAMNILCVRYFISNNHLTSFILFCFGLLILNTAKRNVESYRQDILIKFYSYCLFKKNDIKSGENLTGQ